MDTTIEITKIFTFDSAHQLPGHKGKCARLHGHTYRLEVSIKGPLQTEGSSEGMVMDYGDISEIVEREIISKWDHQFLNDMVSFRTTAENLAMEIFTRLKGVQLPVSRVRLWETAKSFATVNS